MSTTLLLITFASFSTALAIKPEINLHSSKGSTGPSDMILSISDSVPDLSCYPTETKPRRFCVTSGMWIIYGEVNYHPEETDVLVSLPGPCKDLPPWLDQRLNSIRVVGDSTDIDKPSLNLYLDTYYRNEEHQLSDSATEIPYAFNSVIRTGLERWEFFQKENYSGFSRCLEQDEYFVANFTEAFGLEPGNIKSIRIGCSK